MHSFSRMACGFVRADECFLISVGRCVCAICARQLFPPSLVVCDVSLCVCVWARRHAILAAPCPSATLVGRVLYSVAMRYFQRVSRGRARLKSAVCLRRAHTYCITLRERFACAPIVMPCSDSTSMHIDLALRHGYHHVLLSHAPSIVTLAAILFHLLLARTPCARAHTHTMIHSSSPCTAIHCQPTTGVLGADG